jgi:hypothetical protein
MKCNFFIASQLSLVDFHTKLVTAINILEDFQSVSFPIAIQAVAIFVVHKDIDDLIDTEAIINVTLEETSIINNHRIQIHFNENARGIKSITTFGGLILNQPGELKFTLTDPQSKVLAVYSVVIKPTVTTTMTDQQTTVTG